MPAPSVRRGLLAALLLACLLSILPTPARAAGYVNPFAGDTVSTGRTDMGVDLCLRPGQPVTALGDGVVTGILPDWYAGQPYLYYELTDGADAGRYVYVAEQITPSVQPGAVVHAGDVIGRYARRGSCLETGWSRADGETEAQASRAGYAEGAVTAAGVSFARLLESLGIPGPFELTVTPARPVTPARTVSSTQPVTRTPPVTPTPTPAPAPTAAAIPAAVVHRATPRRTARRAVRPAAHPAPRPAAHPAPSVPTTLAAPTPGSPASGGAPLAGQPTPAAPAPWWQMSGNPFGGETGAVSSPRTGR